MTFVPSTSAMPWFGSEEIEMPVMPEPVMKGARSSVPELLMLTRIAVGRPVGGSEPTFTVMVPGSEVPLPLTAATWKRSAPENPFRGV